jgi:hypothetical protein
LLALPPSFCNAESDFARAPDAAPTGKTSEAVKERVCFYAFHFKSQYKTSSCICRKINRVQAVHNGVPHGLCNGTEKPASSCWMWRFVDAPIQKSRSPASNHAIAKCANLAKGTLQANSTGFIFFASA